MAYGDEYFAELDYIETVEKYKEDYEAEVLEDEEDEDLDDATSKTSKSGGRLTPDFEEEEILRGISAKNRRYSDDNDFVCTTKVAGQETGIRTRLRRRNDDDKDTKDPKDAKDSKEVKNTKEVKESKEIKNTKDMKDSKEVKDVKDTKDIKDAKVKEPVVIKQEVTTEINMKAIESLQTDIDTVTISDDEDGKQLIYQLFHHFFKPLIVCFRGKRSAELQSQIGHDRSGREIQIQLGERPIWTKRRGLHNGCQNFWKHRKIPERNYSPTLLKANSNKFYL